MRIWQALAIQEQLRYGESPVVISDSVGLPTSTVLSVKDGCKLADTLFLQYEKAINRCPACGARVKTGCFVCYQKKHPERCVEVIERPDTHKGFMLNVHLYKKEED